jgi:hypothetical protein
MVLWEVFHPLSMRVWYSTEMKLEVSLLFLSQERMVTLYIMRKKWDKL